MLQSKKITLTSKIIREINYFVAYLYKNFVKSAFLLRKLIFRNIVQMAVIGMNEQLFGTFEMMAPLNVDGAVCSYIFKTA